MTTDHMGDTQMPRRRGSRPYVNPPPREHLPPGIPVEAALAEFASRLQKLMADKGMKQSDLARAAARFMPDKKFNRDNISQYVRGRSFPYPMRLNAVARALGVSPDDLKPTGLPHAGRGAAPLEVRSLGDGNVWLAVNQAVPMDVAMKVLNLLGQTDADKSK